MTDSAPAAPPASSAGPVATAPAAPSGPLSHRQILTILIGLMMGMFLAALDQTIVATSIRTIADDLRRPGAPGLGHHRVPDHLDDRHAALRQALRHLRAQAAVHHRDHDLHRRLGAVPLRDVDVRARALPRGPGPRRRRPVLAGAGDHRRHRAAARAREVPGLLPRRVRHASSVLGPVVGGFFAGQETILGIAGWRWVFLVNVPIGIAALAVVSQTLHLHHHAARPPDRLGRRGALIVGLVPLLLVAEQGREWGWTSGGSIACYVLGVLGVDRVLLAERRMRRRGAAPAARCSATGRSAWPRRSTCSSAWACSAGSPRCRCTCRSSRARRRPRPACCCCR